MSKLKQLAFAALALFSATFGADAKSVIVDYYLGTEYKGTAVDYVTPYWAILGSSPITFTLKNNPTGWKVSDWLKASSDMNMYVGAYEPLGVGAVTSYTLTDVASAPEQMALAVRFEPISYTIHFDANGGEGDMADQEFTYGSAKQLNKNKFKLAGYVFAGWSLDEEAEVVDFADRATVYNLTDVDGDSITLYAVWTPVSYTIHFDANGGEGEMDDLECVYDEPQDLPPSEFTREHYKFAGWNTKASGKGTSYEDEAEIMNLADKDGEAITLYAQWEVDTYLVKFDAHGGEGEMEPQEFEYGVEQPLSENAFTRTGYSFVKWNTKRDNTGDDYKDRQKVTDLVNDDGSYVTLYAQWSANEYKVHFDANGGEGEMEDMDITYGSAQYLDSNEYTFARHTFVGWNTEPDGSGTSYADGATGSLMPTESGETVTLYAQWRWNVYTVRFMPRGGEGEMEDQEFTVNSAQRLSKNQFTAKGREFLGWQNGVTGDIYSDMQVVKDLAEDDGAVVKLYAQWTPIEFTVEFNPNGGEGEMASVQLGVEGAPARLPKSSFVLSGHDFMGWNTDPSGSGEAYPDMAISTTIYATESGETIVLYAQWESSTYTVTFDANGGEGSMSDQTFVYDVAQRLTKNAFTREGFKFHGWSTQKNGGGTVYADRDSVVNLTDESDGLVTLYAVWGRVAYTVEFYKNGGEGSMDAVEYEYGSGERLPRNRYERTGYTFDHWCTKPDDTGDKYVDEADGSTLTSLTDVTISLYAIWKPNTYSVRFMPNGGTGTMPDQEFAYDAKQRLSENAFKKTGEAFDHWNTKADDSGDRYADREEVQNLTADWDGQVVLYAQWRSGSYTVKFNPNCEEGEYEGSMDDQAFTYGKTQKLSFNAYTRKSYVFDHWNTEPDDSGDSYKDGAALSKLSPSDGDSITFYAIWKGVSYTVKFDKNGGSGIMPDQTLTYGEEEALSKNEYTRDGWVFVEWNTEPDGSGEKSYGDEDVVVNLADEAGAEVVLYAQWSDSVYYTIHFDENGGMGSMADIANVKYGDSVTLPPNSFTRDDYVFKHWQLEDDASKTFDDGAIVSKLTTKDGMTVTLHAIWEHSSYTVAFEPGEYGKGDTMPNQVFLFGEKQKLSKCSYEADGLFSFIGWQRKGDTTGPIYLDEQAVMNLASVHGETVTLVAQWKDERTDLAKAMHCNNLDWKNVEIKTVNHSPIDVDDPYELNSHAKEWLPKVAADVGYNMSGSCAETGDEKHMILSAPVSTNGTLSFYYKIDSTDPTAHIMFAYCDVEDDVSYEAAMMDRFVFELEKSSVWKKFTIDVDFADWQKFAGGDFPSTLYLHIEFASAGTAQIDQMKWTQAEPPSISLSPAVFRASPYLKVAEDGSGTVSFGSVDKRLGRGAAVAGDLDDDPYSGQAEQFIPGEGTVTAPKSWAAGKAATWKATAAKGSVFSHWKGDFVDTLGLSVNELRNPSLKFVVPRRFDPKGIGAVFVSLDSDGLGELALSDDSPLDIGVAVDGLGIVDDSQSYVTASVSGLPAGLKFDAKTMAITGIPTKAGNFVLKVAAKNAAGYQWAENVVLSVADASGYVQPLPEPGVPKRTKYHPLTVISDYPAFGTVGGTGVYPAGKKVSISARPAKGYVFAGWFCDKGFNEPMVFASGDYRKASQSVVVPEIRYLYARFAKADASVDSVVGMAASGSGLVDDRFKWRVGVAVADDDGVECDSLSLMSGSASGLPPGVKFDAARGRFTGAPTKAGSYLAKISVKNVSKSSAELLVGIDVAALDDWAHGSFDGAAFDLDDYGMIGVVRSLAVSASGKISGKMQIDGATYTLSAPSFSSYDEDSGTYRATLTCKNGKTVFTSDLALEAEEIDGMVRGAISAEPSEESAELGWDVGVYVWQNKWKDDPWKSLAKSFATAPDYDFEVDTQSTLINGKKMLLKFASSGSVTAVYFGRSASAVLVPDVYGGGYMVFIYYPPKSGEFLAYSAWFRLVWDGQAFMVEEGLVP